MQMGQHRLKLFFFFNDTATTEIYTLSLHDALPISTFPPARALKFRIISTMTTTSKKVPAAATSSAFTTRSEEHTSELQSRLHLVCRLLLEKKHAAGIVTTGGASRCVSVPKQFVLSH